MKSKLRLIPGYQATERLGPGAYKRAYDWHLGWRAKLILWTGLATVAIVVASWWLAPKMDLQQQRKKLEVALAKADYVVAKDSLDVLLQESPGNADYRWCYASIEDRLDRAEQATTIRQQLAQEGYGPAVLWLADRDFRLDQVQTWSEAQHSSFVALVSAPKKCSADTKVELNKRLAAYWTQQGEPDKAIESLQQISKLEPAALVNIAALYQQMGDASQAQSQASLARAALEARIEQQPKDVESRLQLVRALMMLDRESEALASVADGFELTGQPVMQQAAGEVLVHWSRRLERTEGGEATFWPRLQLIHRASQCAPQDALVIAAALNLMAECQRNESAKLSELREATARGIERIASHWLHGCLDAIALRDQSALQRLQLAMAESPVVPTFLNNMALAMLERRDFSSDQALGMIDAALKLLPDQPQFIETRGRILSQLDR